MGKVRRKRSQFHESPKEASTQKPQQKAVLPPEAKTPAKKNKSNVFDGIEIKLENLKKLPDDDTRSVVSLKSLKSEFGRNQVSKKDKLKLRREILMQRIDTVQQCKKQDALRKKRKKIALVGDINGLLDALPKLEDLKPLKSRIHPRLPTKKKGILKASQRKKAALEDVHIFKQIISNNKFKEQPFIAIPSQVSYYVATNKPPAKPNQSGLKVAK